MSGKPLRPLRLGVLISGQGTSLENLFDRIEAGEVPAEVAVVVSSKAGAGGLARAERRGVPAVAVPRREHRDVDVFNDLLHVELEKHGVEFVVCLGFLSPFQLRGKFEGKALNVHPALIPAFSGPGMYGHHVYEAVFAKGVKVTGATVHFVDEEYDHGPILLQQAVPVAEDDTADSLSARVQAAERELVPEAIRLVAEGRVTIENGRTRIA